MTTAKLHADTFSILNTTKHPDEAFKALERPRGLARAADQLRRHAGRPGPQQAAFDSIHANYPGIKIDLDRHAGHARLPGQPQPPGVGPGLPKSRAALQAFYNKYRTTPGLDIDAELDTLKTTLQGIFDETRQQPVAPPPRAPGRHSPARAPEPHHSRTSPIPWSPPTMTDTTEALPRNAAARRRPSEAPALAPARPLWGYVFIGPWLVGLVLFTAGPIIASLVLSLTDFDLLHPDQTQFIGLDNYIRMTTDPHVATSLSATFKFAADHRADHDAREPRLRPPA